ncbi:MAG: hypothetical protein IIZ38_06150 [Sphingomonas sp.]|uniref:hypothetical protein n=1 Tax=Sphingomonas sp. TaxID=28214 RepID=UPI0025D5F740|nr:hypothetical protein [Sphingomonas sp.]MBQ1497877.1 hypothetical protein [Sphingomonas sp.]
MNEPVRIPRHDGQDRFLDRLRSQYEAQGFEFVTQLNQVDLPAFFAGYQPDAVALKLGQNVAIEIKSQDASSSKRNLEQIRKLFEGHPDWRLSVAYMGSGTPSVTIPTAEPEAILWRVKEARALRDQGFRQAALVMAWSLLEATLQAMDNAAEAKPRTPGTVLQTLSMIDLISPDIERRARDLINLRNSIVHGDVSVEPSAEDIDLLLGVVEEALRAG